MEFLYCETPDVHTLGWKKRPAVPATELKYEAKVEQELANNACQKM
jgi:hypothetical protein